MGDSLTTCTANLLARLRTGMAALPAPLPILQDINVETGANPPAGGYVQAWPLYTFGERQHSRGGPKATFISTFSWALTVYTPRNTGQGQATAMAEELAALYRMQQIGDLTVEQIDIPPPPKRDEAEAFFAVEVLIRGEKVSEYTLAT